MLIFKEQTDFLKEEINIYHAGCLMMTLLTIAQKKVGKALSKKAILFIYYHLIKRGFMKDGKDRSNAKLIKDSCWIKDHAAVINEGFAFLIKPELRAKYVGCQYLDKKLGKSWGKFEGEYVILHIRTFKGYGHFRLIDYDPYAPSLKYDKILSVRYYKIEEKKNGKWH